MGLCGSAEPNRPEAPLSLGEQVRDLGDKATKAAQTAAQSAAQSATRGGSSGD